MTADTKFRSDIMGGISMVSKMRRPVSAEDLVGAMGMRQPTETAVVEKGSKAAQVVQVGEELAKAEQKPT